MTVCERPVFLYECVRYGSTGPSPESSARARRPLSARRVWRSWPVGLALSLSLFATGVRPVNAQDQVRNFTQPILVQDSDGHHAMVRALIFPTEDGSQLLSGGADKVIHLWSLGDGRTTPLRTIRRPIWRGMAGQIDTMALSSAKDEHGQRILAVAGYGVEAALGEIALFRFPGLELAARETGEIVAYLRSSRDTKAGRGHSGAVQHLQFDPTGKFLASAGFDTNVLIWDVATRQTVAAFADHARPVGGLAYLPGGRFLVTGDALGVVRIWDVHQANRPPLRYPTPKAPPGSSPAITALAVSPNGRWVVVGREDGLLARLEIAAPGPFVPLPTDRGQAAIWALAISHDGSRIATSIESHRLAAPAERYRPDCDVELRSFPEGRVLNLLHRADDRVAACAFSPDDRSLAFAGDTFQTIRVQDLRDLKQPPIRFRGHGASIRDVGFHPDGQAIGFSRFRPGPNNLRYEGFDLKRKQMTTFAAADLDRAVEMLDGWTIRPTSPFHLEATDAQGFRLTLTLNPERDGRWWCYGLLRPRRAGRRPLAAIGCTSRGLDPQPRRNGATHPAPRRSCGPGHGAGRVARRQMAGHRLDGPDPPPLDAGGGRDRPRSGRDLPPRGQRRPGGRHRPEAELRR